MTPQPGDFGLVSVSGRAGWWINIGQALVGDGSRYQHAFVVVADGVCVEAQPSGACTRVLSYYDGRSPAFSRLPLTDEQRVDIVSAAMTLIGTPYSFMDYAALALDHWHVRPAWLKRYIASSKRLICSQLVDECYRRAGVQLFNDGRDPADVTPGDLLYVLVEV